MLSTQFSLHQRLGAIKGRFRFSRVVVILFTICLSVSSELAAFPSEKGGNGWTVELGIGGELESNFAGSNNRQFELSPSLSFAYRDDKTLWYSTVTDYGVYHSINQRWLVGFSAGLELGREEVDDDALTGLGDIDNTWEARLDLAYRATENLTLAGRAMTAGADKDNVYFIAALYDIPLDSNKFELALRSDVSWGSKQHLQTEFGVTPAQSASSGYAVYQPDAGLKSIGAAISGKYRVSEHWFGYTELSYEKYAKGGSDSPFVDNDYDIEVEIGIKYQF